MNEKAILLSKAELNKDYIIVGFNGGYNFKGKLHSIGLCMGMPINVINKFDNGPLNLMVKKTKIALGREMADKVLVKEKKMQEKNITIALAGNPNSGKTTIFNNLTGSKQHVGNYPGVTVEKKEGICKVHGYKIKVVDLPGTYSLTAYSIEEIVARNYIVNDNPDIVVDIVDSSNLERNLYLAIQLIELNAPLILAFNMSDIAKARGSNIDIEKLSELLGVPIVKVVGSKNQGIDELSAEIIKMKECNFEKKYTKIEYGIEIEDAISCIVEKLTNSITQKKYHYQERWIAIKLLEQDKDIKKIIDDKKIINFVDEKIAYIESIYGDAPETIIADKRYGIISGACTESVVQTIQHRHDMSDRIDKIVTNRLLGIPIFLIVMWSMFHWTFKLAKMPAFWLEVLFNFLAQKAVLLIHNPLLESLVVDGIIGGVGGVIVFIPNIMLLFLFIAILEDTGYMARAAFVIDKVMHKIGLHGKSFIPMVIGFGCTVPAYMGSRILENKTDRLITMHINTFMSCSARLPVYVLLCGAFWPNRSGVMMFCIYLIGIIVGLLTAKILRMTRFKGELTPFVMELPIYRIPTLRGLFVHMCDKGFLYLKKAGTLILCASICIWVLMTFPKTTKFEKDYSGKIKKYETMHEADKISKKGKKEKINKIEKEIMHEKMYNSYAGKIGRFIEPVIKPLGFNWKIGISLVSAVMAKEMVVSTMGTIYSTGNSDKNISSLRKKLISDPEFTSLTAFCLMIFVLLYFPCIASMVVFFRETGSLKETLFQMGYTTTLAWGAVFLIYQIGRFF